ncbi:MAG TPA: S-adenosylmethionine:tRNA ribosyltransferase-isomerase [Acidimicrobiales bacterium]|nr:S-adenosylmethionine:tRNA ribosyltransferase-isomerase [Acidimicrobiales bacterium]
MSPAAGRLKFDLPAHLEAGSPAEARGTTRDAVRMMVAYRGDQRLVHSTFALIATFLEPDDLLVINTSATLPAALAGVDAGSGRAVVVHLSTLLDGDSWVVEPRVPSGGASRRWPADAGPPPARILLGEDGASLELEGPYRGSDRLWVGRLRLPRPTRSWLAVHGAPIRYGYVERPFPLSAYQNVYATEPGSAEMPSAGRPFTPDLLTRLVAKGVGITPLVLHTGVASLEADELPYPERVRVPPSTARRVNAARRHGGRVVAVGTTTVRALETAFDPVAGRVGAFDGWTDLVVTPDRGVAVVDGLLTGWHEPEASHLLMLEAIAGRSLLETSYAASLAGGYLWHEFGDVHLILP